MGEKIIFLRPD